LLKPADSAKMLFTFILILFLLGFFI